MCLCFQLRYSDKQIPRDTKTEYNKCIGAGGGGGKGRNVRNPRKEGAGVKRDAHLTHVNGKGEGSRIGWKELQTMLSKPWPSQWGNPAQRLS